VARRDAAVGRAAHGIAPDLRGIGCSSLERSGYDKETMAADVHRLVTRLGFERVALVGHDLGGWVAFAYARSHPGEVSHLAVSGAVLPGFGLARLLDFTRPGQGLPHLVFFMQRQLPERLISGREREFLAHFVGGPAVVGREAFDGYVAAYSRQGRLTAALGQYRTLYQDAADNRRGLAAPLPMPVLAINGDRAVSRTAASLRRVARDVRVATVPGAGHYLPEERPAEFAAVVLDLLAESR
jgi:pimeloyl-ACP methyl ester carboxylesterase